MAALKTSPLHDIVKHSPTKRLGAYDGAEVAELIGLYMLSKINTELSELNFGLYRDDGLAVHTNIISGPERGRKGLVRLFKMNNLKITI